MPVKTGRGSVLFSLRQRGLLHMKNKTSEPVLIYRGHFCLKTDPNVTVTFHMNIVQRSQFSFLRILIASVADLAV